MIIVPGTASMDLGRKVAEILGVKAIQVESRPFRDGESYFRLSEELEGEEVVVVQSTYPPQDKHLIELFLLLDASRDLGAKEVIAVVPYLAYARQDKRFRPGEAVSATTILKLIQSSGANRLLTFDIHKESILKVLNIPTLNLSAMTLIGKYVSKMGLKKPYVFSPDKGAFHLAQRVAAVLRADCTFFEKHRDRETGEVAMAPKKVDVKGRDALVVDDMITTGSSVINAANILREQGAEKIYAACTHPILLSDSMKRLKKAGIKQIIGTDCVASQVSFVSVALEIAEALRG